MKMASSLLVKCKVRQSLFLVKIGATLHTMVMFIGIKQYVLDRTKRSMKRNVYLRGEDFILMND
ncbi:hypothetical protein COJ07_20470 [Bacillus cereus]|uniref:Uncharacterized protein n=1 Tax=Bacillus cereus TaxID=1396 RepID=A0A2B0TJF1_BACCE|nr:hypothetical protein COJ07_20470 [Bacillus cereus]PFU48696.1 hypothetical protein COK86_00365 [Bacillus cereus]